MIASLDPTQFLHSIGIGCAIAMLGVLVVLPLPTLWRKLLRFGRGFALMFLAFAITSAVVAQKPPRPPEVKSMNLTISNVTAKGFDLSWDYGDLTPADFTDGETVRLTARLGSMDYNLIVGTLPVTVTSYHVNAVLRGLPKDWMRYDLEVTARVNNLLGVDGVVGNDDDENQSINDANGDDE